MFKVLYSIAFSSPSEIASFIGDIANTIAGASLSSLSSATDKGMSWEDNTKWPTSTWSVSSNTATPVGAIVLTSPFSAPFSGNKTITLSVSAKTANTEYVMDASISGGGATSRAAREQYTGYQGNTYGITLPPIGSHFIIGNRAKVSISVSPVHVMVAIQLTAGAETLLFCASETTQDDVSFNDASSVPYVMFRSSEYSKVSNSAFQRMSTITFCKVKGLVVSTVVATDSTYGNIFAQALPIALGKQNRTISDPLTRTPIYVAFMGGQVRMQRALAPIHKILDDDRFGSVDGVVTKLGNGSRFIKLDKTYLIEVG